MSVSATTFEAVRTRANYACEYCGVTETESRGLLTIDHYRPTSHDGNDDAANLIYACFRCNLYKADYWPAEAGAIPLWNPREETAAAHLFELDDGRLLAVTETGRETIRRLRLNRVPLVDSRIKLRRSHNRTILIDRLSEITSLLERVQANRASLANEESALLEEQKRILQVLSSLAP